MIFQLRPTVFNYGKLNYDINQIQMYQCANEENVKVQIQK